MGPQELQPLPVEHVGVDVDSGRHGRSSVTRLGSPAGVTGWRRRLGLRGARPGDRDEGNPRGDACQEAGARPEDSQTRHHPPRHGRPRGRAARRGPGARRGHRAPRGRSFNSGESAARRMARDAPRDGIGRGRLSSPRRRDPCGRCRRSRRSSRGGRMRSRTEGPGCSARCSAKSSSRTGPLELGHRRCDHVARVLRLVGDPHVRAAVTGIRGVPMTAQRFPGRLALPPW